MCAYKAGTRLHAFVIRTFEHATSSRVAVDAAILFSLSCRNSNQFNCVLYCKNSHYIKSVEFRAKYVITCLCRELRAKRDVTTGDTVK